VTEPAEPTRRSVLTELAVHGVAFGVAAGIGAIVLSRYYAIFEHDTDSASAARDAFLTAVVITGTAGPAVTLLLFWLRRFIVRKNDFEI
jgi:chromate transport protein ChrA